MSVGVLMTYFIDYKYKPLLFVFLFANMILGCEGNQRKPGTDTEIEVEEVADFDLPSCEESECMAYDRCCGDF